MQSRSMNPAGLARFMEKDPAVVWRWLEGQREPAFDQLEDVAKRFGWKYPPILDDRLVGSEDPARYGNAEQLRVVGTVRAGDSAFVEQDVEDMSIEDAFGKSPTWRHGDGAIFFARVAGESMEPNFPAGSWLALRRTAESRLPDLTPAILLTSAGEKTFKLYQAATDPQGTLLHVLGVPVNKSHQVLVWKPKDVRAWAVVVGTIACTAPVRRVVPQVVREGKAARLRKVKA